MHFLRTCRRIPRHESRCLMPSLCLYFEVHQPRRLRHFTVFDIGRSQPYEDEAQNRQILDKVAEKCYLPANAAIRDLIRRHRGKFRVAYSLTGVILEQLESRRPDVLKSFQKLAGTGCVEFLNETHDHSLCSLYSPREFEAQVRLHRKKIKELFGQDAVTFRNTELLYSNDLAKRVAAMGYRVVLAEGAERILGRRSPNVVYRPDGAGVKVLLRNYRLSDDIAFRFSNRQWREYPLTAAKFAHWIHQNADAQVINLFMDYETFGEHQWQDSGIFDFLRRMPAEVFRHPDFAFHTPSEIADRCEPSGSLDVPDVVSWADVERDLTAWQGNAMQKDALTSLYGMEKDVRRSRSRKLLKDWRLLQTSDHFYYMCTKWFEDGDVHKYFNPYESPYDAYINYMNILDDFSWRLNRKKAAAA